MSATDDVAEIIAIGKRVEELTEKYEPLLIEWSNEVRQYHPARPYHQHLAKWPVTGAINTHILDEDATTPERIAFHYRDYEGSTEYVYLPVAWLENRAAWHAQAAAEQAEYEAAEQARKAANRAGEINRLRAQLAKLEAAQS